jgi:DHA1 family multidrug resistance protein-like MFS transporter
MPKPPNAPNTTNTPNTSNAINTPTTPNKPSARPLIILFIIQFLVMVGFGIVIPILLFLIEDLGGGTLSLGIFMSAYSIMQFFFAPYWGRLSDRIGRCPVLLIGLGGYGLTFFLFGIAGNIPLLILIRALSGMISSATLPTVMAYISDITEGADRSKSMGLIGAASGLGMIFGPVIGGWLGHYQLTLPFFVAGGLVLLVMPVAWLSLPESLVKPVAAETTKAAPRLNWSVLKNPLLVFFGFNLTLSFIIAMFETTFALFASVKVGFGPKEMGTTFMLIGIAGALVQGGLIGRLERRFGDVSLMLGGALISGAGFILLLLAPTSALIVATSAVLMVGTALMGPTSTSLVTKQSTHGQGASLGIFQAFAVSAGSLGQLSAGHCTV